MVRRMIATMALAVLAVACSTGVGAPTATPGSTPTVGPTTGGGSVEVAVASSSFGSHLVGANGKALYLLTTDTANTSTCSGDCAANWPPLLAASATAGAGVTGTLGTFARGTTSQVAINGVPLYYFAGDAAAGDVNGQGLAGVWFLVAPDGTALQGAASPTTPAEQPTDPDKSDDGYGDYN